MSNKSKTAFILGHPVAHSRSPLIHGFWLDCYNIDGAYIPKDIAPEELPSFLSGLDPEKSVGGNITIPHKEAAFDLLDHVTPRAAKLKAINTLYWQGDKLIGDNTDGYGFMTHLKNSIPGELPLEDKVLILGAGGAARPVLSSLINAGVKKIYIANRTPSRAEVLCDNFETEGVALTPIAWADISTVLADIGLLVNTTSLGMTGQPALNIPFELIQSGAIIYDIVYSPLETELLKQARAHNAPAIDGLGMLLHQAVPGFEKWFGRRPEVSDALRALIVEDLEKKS